VHLVVAVSSRGTLFQAESTFFNLHTIHSVHSVCMHIEGALVPREAELNVLAEDLNPAKFHYKLGLNAIQITGVSASEPLHSNSDTGQSAGADPGPTAMNIHTAM
jgi:hypothetical protein